MPSIKLLLLARFTNVGRALKTVPYLIFRSACKAAYHMIRYSMLGVKAFHIHYSNVLIPLLKCFNPIDIRYNWMAHTQQNTKDFFINQHNSYFVVSMLQALKTSSWVSTLNPNPFHQNSRHTIGTHKDTRDLGPLEKEKRCGAWWVVCFSSLHNQVVLDMSKRSWDFSFALHDTNVQVVKVSFQNGNHGANCCLSSNCQFATYLSTLFIGRGGGHISNKSLMNNNKKLVKGFDLKNVGCCYGISSSPGSCLGVRTNLPPNFHLIHKVEASTSIASVHIGSSVSLMFEWGTMNRKNHQIMLLWNSPGK
jgi:hypothetical protein